MALQGHLAKVNISGTATTMTAEACGTSDNTVYQVTNTAKRVLSPTATITVYDDGTPTAESYTVERLTGTITFGSATPRTITITTDYLPIAQIAQANEWSINITSNMLENTVFGATSSTYQPGLKGATGTLGKFTETDLYYAGLIIAGTIFVLELYVSATGDPIKVYCYLDSNNVTATVADLIMTDSTFTITDNLVVV